MGLYAQIYGVEQPKVESHVWPKAFADAVIKATEVTHLLLNTTYQLSDKNEQVAVVAPSTNKLGLSIDHTWSNNDGVFIVTDGTLPGGLVANDLYWVIDSQPSAGTIKLSQVQGGVEIDILNEGVGTHILYRTHPDVMHYHTQRSEIIGTDTQDKRLRQIIWDEKAEGTFEQAEVDLAYTTIETMKQRLEEWRVYISV